MSIMSAAESDTIKNLIGKYGFERIRTVTNEFKSGGGIHIKPSHRGRLTELKKRTGKTEAELYNDGNTAHKKMVVFARNARKWKHDDGGPLLIDANDFVGPPQKIEDDAMIDRQRYVESTYDDSAHNTGSGARGAYQLMPILLKEYKEKTGKTGDPNNYDFNKGVRDWYMDVRLPQFEMHRMGHPTDSVLVGRRYAAYNAGPGKVRSALKQAQQDGVDIDTSFTWLKYLKPETQDYVNYIVRGIDIPGTSKTKQEHDKAKKKHGYAEGGKLDALLSRYGANTILEAIKKCRG